MKVIEEIYYDYINNNKVQDDNEVKSAMKSFEQILEENDVEKKLQNNLSDAFVRYGAESERQGFLYGFTFATRIMSEAFYEK